MRTAVRIAPYRGAEQVFIAREIELFHKMFKKMRTTVRFFPVFENCLSA